MSGGGGSTNTTTTQSGPPQAFIDAFQNVNNQAQQVAATPYTPYPGNTVAPMAPDQTAALSGAENVQGIAAPYINTAAQYINNSTQPLWSSTQQFSPQAVQQYESPYTNDVVHSTENEFNNQNQQQQQGVIGNAISRGAWGGDRSAVAQGILAGQQQLAQAPVIAGLENQGYSQALNEFNQQQGAQLGANQANAWLNSQAGAGMANLGNEAQNSTLTGINALQGAGNIEQQQAQAGLNAPYQQYLAAQAYPFQTTGWLANIAEGLGGASGGTSSTSSPGPSALSQGIGAVGAGVGLLGQTGAFGSNGYLSNLFGSGGSAVTGADLATQGSELSAIPSFFGAERGGEIPQRRAPGGGIVSDKPPFGDAMPAGETAPISTDKPFGISTPDVDVSVVPGSMAQIEMGNATGHAGGTNLMKTFPMAAQPPARPAAAIAYSARSSRIGTLNDGTPVHRYRYGGPRAYRRDRPGG